MIKRPHDLNIVRVDTLFNLQYFEYLEIDLVHINKNSRSKYSVDEVVQIFQAIVNGLILTISASRNFEDEDCSYFVKNGTFENKKYKLVFCICSDRPTSIGLITLHRI